MTRSEGSNDLQIPAAEMAPVLPPPVGPPLSEARGWSAPPAPSPYQPPSHPDRRRKAAVRITVAALAVVALGVAGVIVLGDDDTKPIESGGTTTTVEATDEPAAEVEAVYDEAEAAYVEGRCEEAGPLYEQLVAEASGLGAAQRRVADLHRSECADFLAVTHDAATADAPAALGGYLGFLDDHPESALNDRVIGAARDLYSAAGRQALTVESCDLLAGRYDVVTATGEADPMLGCATVYAGAGRADEAFQLALAVLAATDDVAATEQAVQIVMTSPAACADLSGARQAIDPASHPDGYAALLQMCMTQATTAEDLPSLAELQLAFLTELPLHADAVGVAAAMMDNVAACELLDEMGAAQAIVAREGFIASKTLACAHFAEFVGDVSGALASYQWFVDNAAGDPRINEALAGLARMQIAQARNEGAGDYEQPGRSGSTGSSRSELVIYNDAPRELRVVVTGPETRFETIPASSTSSEYSMVGPIFCPTDVPSLTIPLTPGTYEVMLTYEGIAPSVGTWTLDTGAEYAFCNYIITVFY